MSKKKQNSKKEKSDLKPSQLNAFWECDSELIVKDMLEDGARKREEELKKFRSKMFK